MPIVPNYMNQVNAQNWAEGLGSVVQALNNPQAFANAELLRAKKAEIESSIAYQQGKLGLETQQTAAQVNNYNSAAGAQSALRGKYEAETQGIVRGQKAQDGLGTTLVSAYGVTPAIGQAIQQVAIASNDSNSKQMGDMIANLGRMNPQKGDPGEHIFWAPGDWRKPPPTPQGQAGPATVGNVTTVPTAKTPAVSGANPYAPAPAIDPVAERSAIAAHLKDNPAQKAAQLTQSLDAMQALISGNNAPYQGPLGSALGAINILNPNAQQFNQLSKVAAAASRTEPGAVSNYEQQLFQSRVPNLSNSREANQAIAALGKAAAKKTQETESFVQRFMSQGGSLAQAERIQAEYELDPRSRSVVELPDGGVTLKPNIGIFDWYQEKLNNPGTALGSPNSSPLANAVSGTPSTDLTPDEQAELAALRAKHKR
jgi:hypothetical protein